MKHLDGKRHEFSPCKGCTMNEYSDKDNIDDYAEQIKNKINLNLLNFNEKNFLIKKTKRIF